MQESLKVGRNIVRRSLCAEKYRLSAFIKGRFRRLSACASQVVLMQLSLLAAAERMKRTDKDDLIVPQLIIALTF